MHSQSVARPTGGTNTFVFCWEFFHESCFIRIHNEIASSKVNHFRYVWCVEKWETLRKHIIKINNVQKSWRYSLASFRARHRTAFIVDRSICFSSPKTWNVFSCACPRCPFPLLHSTWHDFCIGTLMSMSHSSSSLDNLFSVENFDYTLWRYKRTSDQKTWMSAKLTKWKYGVEHFFHFFFFFIFSFCLSKSFSFMSYSWPE